MPRELPQKLLRELLRNSKRSDRDLAKIGVSRPTITRTRRKLEKSGIIQDYTIIPDFRNTDFEITAPTFVKMSSEIPTSEVMEEARKYAAKFPDTIFAFAGENLGITGVIASFHKGFADYHRHLNVLRVDWKGFAECIQSFVVSLEEGEFKRFSPKDLKDLPLWLSLLAQDIGSTMLSSFEER